MKNNLNKPPLRKLVWLMAGILVLCGGIFLYRDLQDYLGLVSMSSKEAEQAWGRKEFSPEIFRKSDVKERGQLIADLVEKRSFIGRSAHEMTESLGPWDGYYNSDEIPTYRLPDWNQSQWALVFLPDEQQKIMEVRIIKTCCYHGIFGRIFKLVL